MTDKVHALLVPVEGPVEIIELDRVFNLRQLQDHVQGWIEFIKSDEHLTFIGNEEARIIDPPMLPNPRVNKLLGSWAENYRPGLSIHRLNDDGSTTETYRDDMPEQPSGYAVGPIVITGPQRDQREEETVIEPVADGVWMLLLTNLGIPEGKLND